MDLADIILPDLKKTPTGKWWLGRKLQLRIHLGVYLLQLLFNKTDRQTEWEVKDNAAYQIFCGFSVLENWHCPDHTKIEEFRSRLSPETQRLINNRILKLACDYGYGDPSKMDIDSTIQEANISYPSDANLLVKFSMLCKKVFDYLAAKFPEGSGESIDFKGIKEKARSYFFAKSVDTEKKKQYLESLYWMVYFQTLKVTQLVLWEREVSSFPWNIKRAYIQIKSLGEKVLEGAYHYLENGTALKDKVLSFHAKELAFFNKQKENKKYQIGRAFQLGRIGGNFMIVGTSTSVTMNDKKSVIPMIEEYQQVFAAGQLKSFGTDKGYYSSQNLSFLQNRDSLEEFSLQKPGFDVSTFNEEDLKTYRRLTDRRSGIEPLIGHIKQGGQLGRSKMKSDTTTLTAGYGAVTAFNLRQFIRHQKGKEIRIMA